MSNVGHVHNRSVDKFTQSEHAACSQLSRGERERLLLVQNDVSRCG